MTNVSKKDKKRERYFLPENLEPSNTEALEPFYKDLTERDLNSIDALEKWVMDIQEVDSFVGQQYCTYRVRSSCNINDKDAKDKLGFVLRELIPQYERYSFKLNRKFIENKFSIELPEFYDQYKRIIKNQIELFREENVDLSAEESTESKQYGSIFGSISVDIDGKTFTVEQALKNLQSPDRNFRKKVYELVAEKKLEKRKELDELMDSLLKKRSQIAKNADEENYRDYSFRSLERFDYTPEDCYQFHESIREVVKPFTEDLHKKRRIALQLDMLKPYDLDCDLQGKEKTSPFENTDELVHRTIRIFDKIHPEFGQMLSKLREINHLDLDSRQGKAPGGYNIFMPEKGAPFIFMNSTGTNKDITTMVHEGGHAIHSFYKSELTLNTYRYAPPEISEVASMTMELLAMDHYDEFFSREKDIRNARIEQLEKVISLLPWVASVDEFQHWLYLNPGHTPDERTKAWLSIHNSNTSDVIDWRGYETFRSALWQSQRHIFYYPFYYIEYGIAQLGAIAIWKNYKENPSHAIDQFRTALKMGYSRPIPEVFKAAGIQFDFSKIYIRDLLEFVQAELEKIRQSS